MSSSTIDFSALTRRSLQSSQVSQIIPRSVLRPLKTKNRYKDTQQPSNNEKNDSNTSNAKDSNDSSSKNKNSTDNGSHNGDNNNGSKSLNPNNSQSNTKSNSNKSNHLHNSTPTPTRTFYKRNANGELIPLPISQYSCYEKMDIDENVDSSIYIIDSLASTNKSNDPTSTSKMELNERLIQMQQEKRNEYRRYRKKKLMWKQQNMYQMAQKERDADLLVFELVSKTPQYAMLVSQKNSDSNSDAGTREDNMDENENNEQFSQLPPLPDEQILPKLRLSSEKRLYLEKKRQMNETNIPPKFHPIELENWNTQIDWEGCRTVSPNPDSKTTTNHSSTDNKYSTHQNEPILQPQQILAQTRNPELDALDFFSSSKTTKSIWEGATVPTSSIQPAPLILHESKAGSSIAHLAVPVDRPPPFNQSGVFDQRCQRSGSKEGGSGGEKGNVTFTLNAKDENKEFEQKQRKRSLLESEKKQRVSHALGSLDLGGGKGRTITSSLMGPGGTERTGRPSRHENSSSAHDAENVEQLELVYNHALVKADPRIPELRQFHRPRLPKMVVNTNHPWKYQLRVFPNFTASKKKSSAGSSNSVVIGSYMNNAQRDANSKIRSATDLSANTGALVLFEYCEERPPVQLSKGMASKIVNYYRGEKSRCPVSAGGGDRPTRKRAAQVTNTTLVSTGKAEKPPKLVGPDGADSMTWVDLIGIKMNQGEEKKKTQIIEKPSVNVLPEGSTELLHPKVHGPFIGEVESGVTQSGLICNLFAAPIFRHAPESTDFLMILGKKPSNKYKHNHNGGETSFSPLGVVLRPFPASVFAVGQTEPRIKVSAPNATIEKDFLKAFVTFQIAKALEIQQKKKGRGLKLDDIKEWIFPNTPHLPNYIRGRLKQVANHDTKTQMWTTKYVGEDDYPGVEALGRNFSPEGVAAYESARAAIQRLHDLGIRDLDLGSSAVSNVGAAMVYLNAGATAARERKTKMTKMRDYAKRDKGTPVRLLAHYDKAVSKLEEDAKLKKHIQSVARYIYEELQLTPWHLTSEFIDVHKHNQGTAMMKLTGLGDPSGRGEAYNFLREIDAKPNKETGNSDGALNAQIKKITGTENDLRRLTMKQMANLLLSYGLAQKDIDGLRRWDRVHVIRDVSTRGDGNQDGLEKSKFARGEKMKLSDQKRMYRERIQEIWRRQIAALTSDAGVFDTARGASNDLDQRENEVDIDDSDFDLDDDDEDEDNFYKSLASEIVDERKAKGAMQSASGNVGGLRKEDNHEASTEDAIVYMQWQRQIEEERKAQERLVSARDETDPSKQDVELSPDLRKMVIRRKITKTFADGRQKTTFKFVVLQKEIEKIHAAKKKEQQANSAKLERKNERKNKSYKSTHKNQSHTFSRDESKRVGHAMFEDEDDIKRSDRGSKDTNIKLQVLQNTRIITTKPKKKKNSSLVGSKTTSKSSSKRSITKDQKLKEKQRKQKKLQKRKKELEDDLYSLASQKRGTNNRRERGAARERMPHVMMSQRLEAIRADVERRPSSGPFHRPVNRMDIPQYYEIISNPIDLQTIRDKNSRYEYRTTETFLDDFKLMQTNAIRFNGLNSILGDESSDIYDFVKKTLEASREEFQALEQGITEQLSGSHRKKKKSSTPKAVKTKKKPEENVGAANVILDGLQTTVNLGDINANFDSDSD